MKVYISADIEGVAGTNSWTEASKSSAAYSEFQQQMTRETTAACHDLSKITLPGCTTDGPLHSRVRIV